MTRTRRMAFPTTSKSRGRRSWPLQMRALNCSRMWPVRYAGILVEGAPQEGELGARSDRPRGFHTESRTHIYDAQAIPDEGNAGMQRHGGLHMNHKYILMRVSTCAGIWLRGATSRRSGARRGPPCCPSRAMSSWRRLARRRTLLQSPRLQCRPPSSEALSSVRRGASRQACKAEEPRQQPPRKLHPDGRGGEGAPTLQCPRQCCTSQASGADHLKMKSHP